MTKKLDFKGLLARVRVRLAPEGKAALSTMGLADRLGCTRQFLYQLADGERDVSAAMLATMVSVFRESEATISAALAVSRSRREK